MNADLLKRAKEGNPMKRAMMSLVLVHLLGASVAAANNVTLTLYVHSGSAAGPVLQGALVTCKDAAGKSLAEVTGAAGSATLTGSPGTCVMLPKNWTGG
jgi:hypothetical protein